MRLVFVLFAFTSAFSGDWPSYLGPNLNGSLDGQKIFDKDQFGFQLAWKKELGSGYSQVIIRDRTLYLAFSDEKHDLVAALNTANGEELWRTVISDVYKGHDGSEDGPMATPAADEKSIYGLGAHGHLFALDRQSGATRWKINIAELYKAPAPDYGFASSPLLVGDLLVIAMGGPDHALAAFNKSDGALAWAVGNDTIKYPSPFLVELAGKKQIVLAGNVNVRGVDPETGMELWVHKLSEENIAGCAHVIMSDANHFLLDNMRYSLLMEVTAGEKGFNTREVWSSKEIGLAYPNPVFYEGTFFGYNQAILTAVDAATGERKWRSRPPGKGALMLVDGHLVAWGIDGTITAIKASAAGYEAVASAKILEVGGITPPSFADGQFYVRTVREIAAISVTGRNTSSVQSRPMVDISGTPFASELAAIEKAENKQLAADAFMARHSSMPLIEKDFLHFVYQGDVKDVGIFMGSISRLGTDPLKKVEGTNLWYRSYRVSLLGCYEYSYSVDFSGPSVDPKNELVSPGDDRMSLVRMPQWQEPTFASKESTTSLKDEVFKSSDGELERNLKVYLPPGYENEQKSWPLVLILDGEPARKSGNFVAALDHIMGKTMNPAVVVFMDFPGQAVWWDSVSGGREKFGKMVTEELYPYLVKQYRLSDKAGDHLVYGAEIAGSGALYLGLRHPEVFGKVASQSFYMHNEPMRRSQLEYLDPARPKAIFYLEWCEVDIQDPGEGTDVKRDNLAVAEVLKNAGFKVITRELKSGQGWASWRAQWPEIMSLMFPRT